MMPRGPRMANPCREGLWQYLANEARGLWKQLLQPILTIVENPFHIAPHEKPMNQGPAQRSITHVVEAEGPAIAFLKGMGVMPQRVGSAQLSVNKVVRRLPLGDFRLPCLLYTSPSPRD